MDLKNSNFADIRLKISENADKCVKCALCLPHCPTYNLSHEEGESPRGRLSLMMAIAEGTIEADPSATAHLDHCLDCRACEAVCPANVSYGEILADTRFLQTAGNGSSRSPGLVSMATKFATTPFTRLLVAAAGALNLPAIAGRLPGRLATLLRALPRHAPRAPRPGSHYAASGKHRGRVALFLGCAATALDSRTLLDSVSLLVACGYDVDIPAGQGCCGALAAHAGDRPTAEHLNRINNEVFGGQQYDATIITATGCAAHFRDLERHPVTAISPVEICEFLAETNALADLAFTKLEKNILLQTPCTARNVLRDQGNAKRLLGNIPGIRLREPTSTRCCGAAGSYFIEHPGTAGDLAANLLDASNLEDVTILCSTNYGCGMHLRSNPKLKRNVDVIHPVSLLVNQLAPRHSR